MNNINNAIELLKQKDIEKIMNEIKNYNLKVIKINDIEDENNIDNWYIDGEYMLDYLTYSTETYLNWQHLYEELIKEIKENIKYEIV